MLIKFVSTLGTKVLLRNLHIKEETNLEVSNKVARKNLFFGSCLCFLFFLGSVFGEIQWSIRFFEGRTPKFIHSRHLRLFLRCVAPGNNTTPTPESIQSHWSRLRSRSRDNTGTELVKTRVSTRTAPASHRCAPGGARCGAWCSIFKSSVPGAEQFKTRCSARCLVLPK